MQNQSFSSEISPENFLQNQPFFNLENIIFQLVVMAQFHFITPVLLHFLLDI